MSASFLESSLCCNYFPGAVFTTSIRVSAFPTWHTISVFGPPHDEELFRRGEVVYVGQSDSGRSNAAGGKFRGRIGRLFFRTTGLFQVPSCGTPPGQYTCTCLSLNGCQLSCA